jgi:hypothetical protein
MTGDLNVIDMRCLVNTVHVHMDFKFPNATRTLQAVQRAWNGQAGHS